MMSSGPSVTPHRSGTFTEPSGLHIPFDPEPGPIGRRLQHVALGRGPRGGCHGLVDDDGDVAALTGERCGEERWRRPTGLKPCATSIPCALRPTGSHATKKGSGVIFHPDKKYTQPPAKPTQPPVSDCSSSAALQPHRLHECAVAGGIPHRNPYPHLARGVERNRDLPRAVSGGVGRLDHRLSIFLPSAHITSRHRAGR